MFKSYFVTGIGTDVGKTIASAIITEALEADYFKPIQAGDLDSGDAKSVEQLLSNDKSEILPNAFRLSQPMSPHAAAKIDGVDLLASIIKRPKLKNNMVIEGAGGLLVPINDRETIADLIRKSDRVILVSQNYLGSINHSLLSIAYLNSVGIDLAGIIFNGPSNPESERIILSKADCACVGRIKQEEFFSKDLIKSYAEEFKTVLKKL
jgi:dethiobiotin synthetase